MLAGSTCLHSSTLCSKSDQQHIPRDMLTGNVNLNLIVMFFLDMEMIKLFILLLTSCSMQFLPHHGFDVIHVLPGSVVD